MMLLLQSVIASHAFLEFGQVGYPAGLTIAVYSGMFLGAIFWGLGADIVGRKYAFNISLFLCSAATIVAGAAPSWPSLGFFVALIGFGAGGNLILDATVFLEYLPGKKQWVLTFMACWWGLGLAINGFIAWGFLGEPTPQKRVVLFCLYHLVPAQWNCGEVDNCPRSSNMGWRYTMWTAGGVVFMMSAARVTVIRLKETPKYLLAAGEDVKLLNLLEAIAIKYKRPCSLSLENLQACGTVRRTRSNFKFSTAGAMAHLSGLFQTKKIAISTVLIWTSWTLMGLAYPLFYVFLEYVLV